MKTLIRRARIINEGKHFEGSVLIEGNRIREIAVGDASLPADRVIDGRGLLLLPGVIDDQVHFREPGLTHKGDLYTESKAAVAGGVTSYMEMPNTLPQTVTVPLLEEKFRRAEEVSLANFSFYMGATNHNIGEVLKTNPRNVCGIKCFMGSSTGNMLVEGEGLETLFRQAHMLVAVHSEDESIIRSNMDAWRQRYGEDVPVSCHPLIRSEEACYRSTVKAIDLAHRFGTRLHILHLSTARETRLLEPGRPDKKQITGEVCVHHLWFDETDYVRKGNLIKWNPAIKTHADKLALRQALTEGRIDIVATDHAPHTREEKQKSYFQCPSGGPLVQHSLVTMLELVQKSVFTYEQVVEKMCHAPAELFGIEERGFIRKGYKADLVLVDPRYEWEATPDTLLYKCGWSPFDGFRFSHRITHTFVNGNLVYNQGYFDEQTKGEALVFLRDEKEHQASRVTK
ncbi:MAG TPA: dihydroorotase [Prolixibacteraceae bacterium]|nr:dihydroorotase [Prolixibacteraceae bacterium]